MASRPSNHVPKSLQRARRFRALTLLSAASVAAGCQNHDLIPIAQESQVTSLGVLADVDTMSPEALRDPETCKSCHVKEYETWRKSAHARAGDDPVFIAMNKRAQRETKGRVGSLCVNCHAPVAVEDGLTQNGNNLAELPPFARGVTCFACHATESLVTSHNRGVSLGKGQILYGGFTEPSTSSPHKAAYSPLFDRKRIESSKMCGSCHDIVTPAGDPLETTYDEWHSSVFGHGPGMTTCSQCHMPKLGEPIRIEDEADGQLRQRYNHLFPAVDVDLNQAEKTAAATEERGLVRDELSKSLQTALCVKMSPAGASIRVLVDSVAAGHGFLSGAVQDRRLWTEVKAFRDKKMIYATGVVSDAESPGDRADPDLWQLGSCMVDAKGNPVEMFWESAHHTLGTLAALNTFNTADPNFYRSHVVQSFPRARAAVLPEVPTRVTLRIRLQAIGQDLLRSLVASGDLAPEILTRVPTFDVGPQSVLEWRPERVNAVYDEGGVPVRCVTQTNLNVRSNKVWAEAMPTCLGPNARRFSKEGEQKEKHP